MRVKKKITVQRIILSLVAILLMSYPGFSQLNPMTIGTIHPNDSIVIYYDVSITSGAGGQVSNQGTVTATGINMVTDDPDTGTPNDPTITPLNMFPLPAGIFELKAIPGQGNIQLYWNVRNEPDIIKYEIERSPDGRSFTKIGEVVSRGSLPSYNYSFLDSNPHNGINYFRLRIIEQNSNKYSVIIRVDMSAMNSFITLYPNPVLQKQFALLLSNIAKGKYELALLNSAGQVVYTTLISHDGGTLRKDISLPAALPVGTYIMRLKNEKILHNQLVIIQRR
jgi:hypothetical protein